MCAADSAQLVTSSFVLSEQISRVKQISVLMKLLFVPEMCLLLKVDCFLLTRFFTQTLQTLLTFCVDVCGTCSGIWRVEEL